MRTINQEITAGSPVEFVGTHIRFMDQRPTGNPLLEQ
jgi:hypothetical protein